MKRLLLALALFMAIQVVATTAQAQVAQRIRQVMGTDLVWREIAFDASGYPIIQCVSPAAGNDVNVHAGDATAIGHTLDALKTIAYDAAGVVRTIWAVSQSGTWDINDISGTITLPTGAARDTTSLLILADTNDILLDTTSIDGKTPALGAAAVVGSVPVGIANDQINLLSTAALQTTGNAVLVTIDAVLDAIYTRQGDGNQITQARTYDSAGGGIDSQTGALSVALEDGVGALLSVVLGNLGVALFDGSGGKIDSRTGGLAVVQEDGSGNLVDVSTETTSALILADTTSLLVDSGVIAADTTSIDGKTPALGAAAVAGSVPVGIASDQIGLLATKANQLPDGHNVTNDNAAGAAAVNVQDGGNSLTVDAVALPLPTNAATDTLQTTGNGHLSTIATNTTAGTAVDSASVAQQGSWLDVTDGSSPDGAYGVIDHNDLEPADTDLPLKLYVLPAAKAFHEITITATDDDTNDFEYDLIILTTNNIPSAVYDFDAWMSVGALVVPQWKVARDATKAVISQPLIRTHASYLVLIVISAVTEPATDPQMRVLSYDDGDSR